MLNYSSEDSALQRLGERRLHTFYCSCCGANALVAEVDFEEMPRRGTDESYVLQVGGRRLVKRSLAVLRDSFLSSIRPR